jgi:hypothetical protein
MLDILDSTDTLKWMNRIINLFPHVMTDWSFVSIKLIFIINIHIAD